ncbi:MAG: IPT/TIG domain-containing protein [Dehalococcoidia bacterium]|jgi:hypothetical protein
MKHSKIWRVLGAAVVLCLLMMAIPATPAMAQTIALSAYNGPPGTVITVSGSGFLPGTAGEVWFDSDGDGYRDSGEPWRALTTDGSGNIPSGVTLTVPAVERDSYYVWADISIDEDYTAFTVTPEIFLDEDEGYVGDTIIVDGQGFYGGATVTVYYDGSSVGTKATTSSGTFTNFTFTVPDSVEGFHDVDARDSAGFCPEVLFEISPKITLSPISGDVGDTITVTGKGFDASSDVDVYFGSTNVASAITNTKGTFTDTFVVPSTSRGSHTVNAEDEGSNEADATFTVSASININPASGPSGTTVTVTGNGFDASRTVTITYNSASVTTNPTTVTTNTAGSFSATFSVPVGMAGNYPVVATDGVVTASATFTSTTSATISPETSATSPGHVGSELTITGTGFTPNATITVTYSLTGTQTDTLATVTSNASGNFTIPFTIPASTHGAHTITVTDGTISMPFDFVMESTPPAAPELTLPLPLEKLKDNLFEWTAVTDDSMPVTYNIQVCSDNTFATASLVVNETGLTAATYTLPEDEKLESANEEAPYYWRVQAVDAASNTGAWSTPGTFTTGWSFEFSGWVVYVTMAVIAIAFFFLGLWLGRRGGGGGYY